MSLTSKFLFHASLALALACALPCVAAASPRNADRATSDDGLLKTAGRATEKGFRATGAVAGKGVRAVGKGISDARKPVGKTTAQGVEAGVHKTGDGLQAVGKGAKKAGGAIVGLFGSRD